MNLTHYEWHYRSLPDDWQDKVAEWRQAGLGYSDTFLRLCLARGLETLEEIKDATNQMPQTFHDAFLLYDMERAVERIQAAIEGQEVILIYGDYDADGITSTLILYETLEMLGARVIYYVPNRLVDGYGPNLARYQDFVDQGVQLILTCDNGVAGFEAIEWAMQAGVDVIVTDHHEVQATLPSAYAVVHPRHPEGHYPFPDLSGAGVALKLATALLGEVPTELVELAAIGTVSDVVSLRDENRTLVLSGLQLMRDTMRIGLRLMLEEEQVDMENMTADTIGFTIGPRLNAIGRLGDPTPALELLKTQDEEEAQELLALINEKNQERKDLVANIMDQVSQRLGQGPIPHIIIESDPSWPAGVVGIVAGRLSEHYQRPALIFQYQADKGQYKGSGRSTEAVHLFDWLTDIKEHLAQFGGHAQAAGMTVNQDQWQDFVAALQAKAQAQAESEPRKAPLTIDLSLKLSEIGTDFIQEVQLLGPFGMDNDKPVFAFEEAKLNQVRLIGTNSQHAKLVLGQDGQELNAIGFDFADRMRDRQVGDSLTAVGHLDLNKWQNRVSPQLLLSDIGVSGAAWYDWRASGQQGRLWQLDQVIYVCQREAVKAQVSSRLQPGSGLMTYQEVQGANLTHYQGLVLLEPPKQMLDFDQLVLAQDWQAFYLVLYAQESKYLAGLPQRADFAKLYRWLVSQEPFNLRARLAEISQGLAINPVQLKLMFHVFYEAGFVSIEEGQVAVQDASRHQNTNLEETAAYRAYQAAMDSEEALVFATLDQIKEYVKKLGVKS